MLIYQPAIGIPTKVVERPHMAPVNCSVNAPFIKLERPHGRKTIADIYRNDPYLKAHIELTNVRQRQRCQAVTKQFKILDKLVPDDIAHDWRIKCHSKLGILVRTIAYIKALDQFLNGTENI